MEPYLRVNFGAEHSGRRLGMTQIVDAIARQIGADRALQGCRLPPIRVLAHQLGVSKNTVSAAYEELRAKSLVESRGRSGLYIATNALPPPARAQKLNVPLPPFKPLIRVSASTAGRPGTISLSSVFIDPKLLPREKLTACFRSVLKAPGLAHFSDRQGFPPLRQKIAERLRRRGIEASPEHIVTTVGAQQVLDLVCRSLESKVIATENPAYYLGKALFEMNGITPVGLPIEPFTEPFRGVNLELWESRIKAHRPGLVYVTPNFQNPTGYSYSSQEMAQLIEWSREYGFGILEDDWGSDMLSYSEFKPSLRSLGGSSVLYMNSFTKKVLPALRVGYVVGNERTAPSLAQSKRLSIGSAPALLEAALFEFLDRGYYDAHLKAIQLALDARYENCLKCLRAQMPEEVRWTSPGGGPILWLELPRRVDLARLRLALQEREVSIQLSDDAFFGTPHLHGFKIGYAFLATQAMERAIEILGKTLRAYLKAPR